MRKRLPPEEKENRFVLLPHSSKQANQFSWSFPSTSPKYFTLDFCRFLLSRVLLGLVQSVLQVLAANIPVLSFARVSINRKLQMGVVTPKKRKEKHKFRKRHKTRKLSYVSNKPPMKYFPLCLVVLFSFLSSPFSVVALQLFSHDSFYTGCIALCSNVLKANY